jgi:major membrane immunogen (membrane-anchored lipoprotein)
MQARKVVFLLISLLLILSLAGCGASNDQQQPEQETPQGEAPQNGTIADGDYVGYSDADPESHGEARVQLTIKDGKIAEVKIDEIQDGSTGHAVKDLATYPHQPAVEGDAYFKDKFTGLSSVEEIREVDDFAGITHSSEKFKLAAERALVQAGTEKTGTYFDGTFMGYSDTSAEKGFATAYVTIKNNAIESVVLEEWQPDQENPGSFNLKDYASYPLKEAQEGNEYFTQELVGAAGPEDVDALDDYAGVTHSSENYKAAVKMALEKAKQ